MTSPDLGTPVRVLHVLQHFGIGGVQRQCADRFAAMPGHVEQRVAALNGDLRMRATMPECGRVEFIDAPQPTPHRPYFTTLLPWLRAQRPDVLLTYGWGTTDALFAALLLRVRRVVHAEDGFGPAELPQQLRRRLWARRLLFRGVSRLVVPSQTLRCIARQSWHVPEDRITFLPSGVDTARWRPGTGVAVRTRLGIPHDAIIFGSVGRIEKGKDLHRLIDALGALPNALRTHVVLVGDGAERDALARRAARLGVDNRVHWIGFTADPSEYYQAFDVFVLTSRSEQRPLALLEAMATGLPVVSTDVGDVGEMVSASNRRFVIASGDDAALVQALSRLAEDPQARRQLGQDNRRRCETEFDVRHVVAGYLRLYEDLTRDAAGAPR